MPRIRRQGRISIISVDVPTVLRRGRGAAGVCTRRRRAELEIRAVLVSWRDAMADIRAGLIPESRQSVHALAMLDDIERKHGDDQAEVPPVTSQLFAGARSEIQGATMHGAQDWKAAQ